MENRKEKKKKNGMDRNDHIPFHFHVHDNKNKLGQQLGMKVFLATFFFFGQLLRNFIFALDRAVSHIGDHGEVHDHNIGMRLHSPEWCFTSSYGVCCRLC